MDKKLSFCIRPFLFIFISLSILPVAAEQLTCEQAREKLIAPLRKAKIKECKSDPKNDPAGCERYYATYGDATPRPGGGVNPRMFDDIPECKNAK